MDHLLCEIKYYLVINYYLFMSYRFNSYYIIQVVYLYRDTVIVIHSNIYYIIQYILYLTILPAKKKKFKKCLQVPIGTTYKYFKQDSEYCDSCYVSVINEMYSIFYIFLVYTNNWVFFSNFVFFN